MVYLRITKSVKTHITEVLPAPAVTLKALKTNLTNLCGCVREPTFGSRKILLQEPIMGSRLLKRNSKPGRVVFV